jgi:hypothetical protein
MGRTASGLSRGDCLLVDADEAATDGDDDDDVDDLRGIVDSGAGAIAPALAGWSPRAFAAGRLAAAAAALFRCRHGGGRKAAPANGTKYSTAQAAHSSVAEKYAARGEARPRCRTVALQSGSTAGPYISR